MSVLPTDLLRHAHELLEQLNRPGEDTNDAPPTLQPLRNSFPDYAFRLLRHRENVDDSLCWGLLIMDSHGSTTSLSWTPPRAIPWPLRGAQRASELALLRVNGVELSVEDAIRHLDVLWDQTALLRGLVDSCLVRQELAQAPIDLTDEQLQRSADEFRRARNLLTVEQTQKWMDDHYLDQPGFERLVEFEASLSALRTRVAESESTAESLGEATFERWLEARRTQAKVEWFWGPADKTAGVGKSRS